MATSLKNILPDYEGLFKDIARVKMELKILAELKRSRETSFKSKHVWGYSENYEWKSAWNVATSRLQSLELRLQALEKQYNISTNAVQSLCDYYPEDEAEQLAQLEHSISRMVEVMGNGDPEQLAPLLKQKELNPNITQKAYVNRQAEPLTELNKLSATCKLRIESEAVRLRFVYQDAPDEAVNNSHIIYWLYDNHPERPDTIEQDADAFFEKTQLMMPIGIGLTNSDGFLIQSVPIPESLGLHHINRTTNQVMVKPKLSTDKLRKLRYDLGYDKKAYNDAVNGELNLWGNTKAFGDVLLNYDGLFKTGASERDYLYSLRDRAPVLNQDAVLSVSEQVMLNLIEQGFNDHDEAAIEKVMVENGWYDFKARQLTRKITNQYFYRNRRYGFMLYPIDRGSFISKDVTTLTQALDIANHGKATSTFTTQGAAWAEQQLPAPEKDQPNPCSTIAIYCTLPEWDRRLCEKLAALEDAHQAYRQATKPHLDNLLAINQMEQLTELYGQYHYAPLNNEESETIASLSKNLGDMGGAIEKWLSDQTDTPDFPIAKIQKKLDDCAQQLWALLNSPALANELKRYINAASMAEPNGGGVPAGPYMAQEPYWLHIYDTLPKCYAAFKNTSLAEEVWEKHVKDCVWWVAEDVEGETLKPDDDVVGIISRISKIFYFDDQEDGNNLSPLIARLYDHIEDNLYLNKSPESNPLLTVLNAYKKLSDATFHNQPGPPSLMQTLLDTYADYVSKLVRRHSVGKKSLHIKLFFGVMRLYGVSPDGAEFHSFKHSIYHLLRAHGRQYSPGGRKPKGGKNVLSRNAREVIDDMFTRVFPVIKEDGKAGSTTESFSDQAYNARSHIKYKSAMQVMNWMLLFESWGNLPEKSNMNTEETLRYIGNVIDNSGNTLIKAIQARELISSLFTSKLGRMSPPSASLVAVADTIAQRLTVLAGVMATVDAYNHFNHGLYGKSAKDVAFAASAGMLAYGHAVKKWGQTAASSTSRTVAASVGTQALRRRVGVMVASVLFVPVVGEVGLIVGGIVMTGLAVIDTFEIVSSALRKPLHQLFHGYWDRLITTKVKVGEQEKQLYLDFYTGEFPESKAFKTAYARADAQRETSRLIEDSAVDWRYLTWRAVVPLHLMGRPLSDIKALIKLPEGAPRYAGGNTVLNGHRTIKNKLIAYMDVDSIIAFYQALKKQDDNSPYDSTRTCGEVRVMLERGCFRPLLDEPQPTFGIVSQHLNLNTPVSWAHKQFQH
ncbi:hypothetical protein [Alkalimarinus sediminis]|uniref:Uncharacterized protein n=1 Tax=Alkalimarinus sediminis TaxID=1632866 RepID=A0A9E8KQ92_9ALTE|nr:hypothetical protein [Alkalimarinus sediminis]UZW74960.1 hypothetical protein NNL22_18365 [Alkalimarinus sediminis]